MSCMFCVSEPCDPGPVCAGPGSAEGEGRSQAGRNAAEERVKGGLPE